jgi:hypothetical protein
MWLIFDGTRNGFAPKPFPRGEKTPKEDAMKKLLILAAALTVVATPALADFFIVREGPTGPCKVVETRPTDTKIVVVGNKVYKERSEAEKEVTVVCK